MDIFSILNIKMDIVAWAFIASVPTLLVSIIAPIILHKIQNKDQIRNKNAIDKLWYRMEIMELIKEMDGFFNEILMRYNHWFDQGIITGNKQYLKQAERIKELIKWHFPKLEDVCREYINLIHYNDHDPHISKNPEKAGHLTVGKDKIPLTYVVADNDPFISEDTVKLNGKKYHEIRDKFIWEIRKDTGL